MSPMHSSALEAPQKTTTHGSSATLPESSAQTGMSESSSIDSRPMESVSPERQAALVPLHYTPRAVEETLPESFARPASLGPSSTGTESTLPASPQHQSALMRLPEEILLNIFSMAIPRSLTELGTLGEGYPRTEIAYRDAEFFRYSRDTAISRRLHIVANEALFRTYTHDVRLYYSNYEDPSVRYNCDTSALQPRRAEVERLTLYITGNGSVALKMGVRDLPGLLGTYPRLRKVDIFIETFGYFANIADLEELLREQIEAWKRSMLAEKRVKLRVEFECHNHRVVWEGMGERRVVDLSGHVK
ncbi:hypothetical protein LTR91_004644 [Friedmanniomyces endolithicus]|uniref:F-box domain-containing protein n=1 Tax=Friedmanniomyces endolithicus TaxID=329885 RepID=A0AAN6QYT6_9PEZI|nr:hypothetical protein LTR57_005570 [Friedmanniomyces endolithicus]KAK0977575.1 hypothetical protein LTS01_013040 [Friedmanniomyces endolithicus]KAK1003643.1 hypothetical protein LTR91_004644 [Friedmanniomyces endolithicus]KAK1028355.1 hypothetical protein LTS16_020698 [Friedmanniomyces endolithicus]